MLSKSANENPVTKSQFNEFQNNTEQTFKEIKKILKQHTNTFVEIKKVLSQHTNALLSIENTMKFYGDMYHVNKESIDKLSIRVETLEKA